MRKNAEKDFGLIDPAMLPDPDYVLQEYRSKAAHIRKIDDPLLIEITAQIPTQENFTGQVLLVPKDPNIPSLSYKITEGAKEFCSRDEYIDEQQGQNPSINLTLFSSPEQEKSPTIRIKLDKTKPTVFSENSNYLEHISESLKESERRIADLTKQIKELGPPIIGAENVPSISKQMTQTKLSSLRDSQVKQANVTWEKSESFAGQKTPRRLILREEFKVDSAELINTMPHPSSPRKSAGFSSKEGKEQLSPFFNENDEHSPILPPEAFTNKIKNLSLTVGDAQEHTIRATLLRRQVSQEIINDEISLTPVYPFSVMSTILLEI